MALAASSEWLFRYVTVSSLMFLALFSFLSHTCSGKSSAYLFLAPLKGIALSYCVFAIRLKVCSTCSVKRNVGCVRMSVSVEVNEWIQFMEDLQLLAGYVIHDCHCHINPWLIHMNTFWTGHLCPQLENLRETYDTFFWYRFHIICVVFTIINFYSFICCLLFLSHFCHQLSSVFI